ncbi:MAG: pentapeptide repeat-containing protein [Polyangiaceae bacterium]
MPEADSTEDLQGTNLGGTNLGGTNLGGTNLGGTNLAGPNLGGTNLGGTNLGGTNLGGTNLGGNNLGGTNLGGTNLGGTNLGGTNLGGTNLGGTNLGGTNLGGTNLGGNNLGGTNLGGTNLGGTNTGINIHALSGALNGMLYSGEDQWQPKTSQCIVMGLGSTAFSKLLAQQSAGAKISVALGKLPWGFSTQAGGAVSLNAWEAIVWGDKTYCTFVLGAPPSSTWAGVAGFVKAVFRWNAPTTQSMDISGIEASAKYDTTVSTQIATYTGMMDASAKLRAGSISAKNFIAGELAFVSATTNNQTVQVDFASWIKDASGGAAGGKTLVLGNVTSSPKPTYAESVYSALENSDGSVQIVISSAIYAGWDAPSGMVDSYRDLDAAWSAYRSGKRKKPVPRRCGGALYLKYWKGEALPAGKCDSGLGWSAASSLANYDTWDGKSGTTAPMNKYMLMQLSGASTPFRRSSGSHTSTDTASASVKPVLSETYIHMWEPNYD